MRESLGKPLIIQIGAKMKDDKEDLTKDDIEEVNQHGKWLNGCILIFLGLIAIGVLLEGC